MRDTKTKIKYTKSKRKVYNSRGFRLAAEYVLISTYTYGQLCTILKSDIFIYMYTDLKTLKTRYATILKPFKNVNNFSLTGCLLVDYSLA